MSIFLCDLSCNNKSLSRLAIFFKFNFARRKFPICSLMPPYTDLVVSLAMIPRLQVSWFTTKCLKLNQGRRKLYAQHNVTIWNIS